MLHLGPTERLGGVHGTASQFSISVKFVEGYASHHDSQGDAPLVWGLLDKRLIRIGEGLELRSVRGFKAVFDAVAARASLLAAALPTAHGMGITMLKSWVSNAQYGRTTPHVQ